MLQLGNTSLILAAKYGHYTIVKELLERGADKDHENKVGSVVVCALEIRI